MSDLSGKRALVTGAGMGIGQAIAVELARRGADVAVHYAHTEPDETVEEIERSGKRAPTVQGDLSKVAECERVVDEAADSLGGLDVLVNNAGITRALGFLETDEATYDEVFDLNMKGYFFCARRAVPLMLEAGGGSIVNITSIHGHAGFPRHAAYAATKGAIIAFTRTLAIDLAPHRIRVNAIGPGPALTDLTRARFSDPAERAAFEARVPLGRLGEPDDIAGAAVFLASDAASAITAETIFVDNGYHAMGMAVQR